MHGVSKINSDNENNLAASYLIKMIMYDVYKTIIQDALDPDTGLNEITEQSDDLYSLQAVYRNSGLYYWRIKYG